LSDPERRDRAGRAPVARIATVRRDGQPRVVPCCFALSGDRVYWAVDHKPKTTQQLGRLDDIAVHPAVSLVVDHYDDDWSRLWWVRMDGDARVVTDEAERELALDLLAAKYLQYREHRPEGAVVAVEISRWRSWAAGPAL
jgi:PPOX class probable F420-dependent enzyme